MINLDDLANKIQSILSDEESMRQIKELAEMFSSGGGFSETSENSGNFSEQNTWNNDNSQNSQSGESDFDFGSLLGGLDLGVMMQLMAAFTSTDKNSELLMALKPHLSDDKQHKVDKAVKMLKLYNIYLTAKESGMLNNLDKLL